MIKRYGFWQLLLTLLLIFCSCMSCFAEDGTGDGGGQNQEEPLTLVSSSIKDGQKEVPVDAAISLEFSKNVVNMTVAESNKSCISLTDREGKDIPIEIRMGDDQVDPTIKRQVIIIPDDPFEPANVYTLTISGSLQSKSGTSLGAPIIIAFQTAGGGAGSVVEKGEKEGIITDPETQGVATGPGLSNDSPDSAGGASTGTAMSQAPARQKTDPWLIFSAVCFIAGAVLLVIFVVRRTKK